MVEVFDTNAAAEYCGMPLSTFKWWVWRQPDKTRRLAPSGYVGRSPYWTGKALDAFLQSKRGPGRPKE